MTIKPDVTVRVKTTGRKVKVIGAIWNKDRSEYEYLCAIVSHKAYMWYPESELDTRV